MNTAKSNVPAVVVIGNLSEGRRAVGPFPSFDDAFLWADYAGYSTLDSCIMEIVPAPPGARMGYAHARAES
jgi:hypothetical protein